MIICLTNKLTGGLGKDFPYPLLVDFTQILEGVGVIKIILKGVLLKKKCKSLFK